MKTNVLFQSCFLLVLAIVLSSSECQKPPAPIQRPGNNFEGSAMWAVNLAQPTITAFAADAKVYWMTGSCYKDGRLPTNRGYWTVICWSPSLHKEIQVKVNFDNQVSTVSEKPENTATSKNGQPLPIGWLNSPQIFQVIAGHRNGTDPMANMILFNGPTNIGNDVSWRLAFDWGGANEIHNVKWDGTYMGNQ